MSVGFRDIGVAKEEVRSVTGCWLVSVVEVVV